MNKWTSAVSVLCAMVFGGCVESQPPDVNIYIVQGEGGSSGSASNGGTNQGGRAGASVGGSSLGGAAGESGSSGAAGQAGLSGAAGASCTPHLTAKFGPTGDAVALPGQPVSVLEMEFEASDCADIHLNDFAIFLESLDTETYCKEPCQAAEDWNLRNPRIMNDSESVWGTKQFAFEGTPHPLVRFQDINQAPFTLKAGTKATLRLVVDVAEKEVVPGTLFGKRFRGQVFTYGFDYGVESDSTSSAVVGYQIIQAPAPQANYCGAVTTPPSEEFGFWGCCGTFKQAATPAVGYLFKGSGKPVYYMAYDGKRYVFPTSVILDSWYSQNYENGVPQRDDLICNQVTEIPDDVIAAINIGGNVTLRPGVYLTGYTTDPKRYVVSKGRVLHWLESEALAEQVYGAGFQDRVRRVPDAFFVNFLMGESYSQVSQYDLVTALATTLEQDLGIVP